MSSGRANGRQKTLEGAVERLLCRLFRAFSRPVAESEVPPASSWGWFHDLGDLHRILHALGPRWRVVYSDYRLDAGGHRERVGFLYREDRVRFTGLASHAETERRRVGEDYTVDVPWWRPPFLASFQAGDFAFHLVAAHVRWGATVPARETELRAVGEWLARRRKEIAFGGEHVLVVGDFNIANNRSQVWTALVESGLVQAPGLAGDPGSNLVRGRRYDRILCAAEDAPRLAGRAGVVDVYDGDGFFFGGQYQEYTPTDIGTGPLPVYGERNFVLAHTFLP